MSQNKQDQQNDAITKFLYKYNVKYTIRQLKGDFIAGTLNGALFGLSYAYYFMPFELSKPQLSAKYRNSKILYSVITAVKLGVMFGTIRSSFNAISKQQLSQTTQIGAKIAILFGMVSLI